MRGRAAVRYAAYAALFLAGTLIFLISTFPGDRMAKMLNGKMEKATGGVLSSDSVSFVLPLSLKLTGISVRMGESNVKLGNATVSMGPGSLVGSDRKAKVVIEGPWGKLPAAVEKTGMMWRIKGRGDGIDLSLVPGVQDLPVELSGQLSVDLDLDVDEKGGGKISGKGNARVTGASIGGGAMALLGAGGLKITRGTMFWSIEDNLLTLGEAGIQGDIIGSAKGTALLYPSRIENSRLNMALDLRPSAAARKRLTPLFILAGARPKADGTVTVKVGGTAQRPKFSL